MDNMNISIRKWHTLVALGLVTALSGVASASCYKSKDSMFQTLTCNQSGLVGTAAGQSNSFVAVSLTSGQQADTFGFRSNGRIITSCYVRDTTPGGGFVFDTSGCSEATQHDLLVF